MHFLLRFPDRFLNCEGPMSPKACETVIRITLGACYIQSKEKAEHYRTKIELAKPSMARWLYGATIDPLNTGAALGPQRPEACNLIGVIHEIRGWNSHQLEQHFLSPVHDTTYKLAYKNIDRVTTWSQSWKAGRYDLGERPNAKRTGEKGAL